MKINIHQIDNKTKSFSQLCECFVYQKIFLLPSLLNMIIESMVWWFGWSVVSEFDKAHLELDLKN